MSIAVSVDTRVPTSALPLADPGLLRDQAFIDGQWVDADSGETFTVENPASGETVADVACCGAAEARRAIEAAARAFETWRHTTVKERAALLRRWFDLMMENQEDLARILTAEQGKPLAEARGEIAYGGELRRVVLGRGQAGVRRHHPPALQRQAHRLHQAARRRGGLHHPVELPQRHARAERSVRPSPPAARWSASPPTRRLCRLMPLRSWRRARASRRE